MRNRFGAALLPLAALLGCVPAIPPSVQPPADPPPAPPAQPFTGEIVVDGAFEQGGWLRGRAPAGTVRLTLGAAPVALTSDGRFFAGLDRDAPAQLRLTATSASSQMVTNSLPIAARDWQIERVNVPLRGSVPSETFMAIRRPELAAIEAARAVRSDSDGWAQRFIWPVTGRISGRFGSQRIYQGVPGSYHSGLDIATGTSGTPYVAPADGVVVLAAQKPFSLEGNLLIVDHGMGLNSAFLHSSRLFVKEGDRVRQGQQLGTIGATGRASGPHLHWSLKWQDARLDPLLFLPPMP
ncbi:MAG TPA: M23 family metallopeptidase [Qipengyuania sp.]|nr:M23 family metallopeptidase [Qipengyuania sp.]